MIQRHGTTKRYSDSTCYNGVVYLVEVPSIEQGDIVAQATDLLANVDARLAEAGSNKSQLLQVQIFLTDMADYDGFNTVWEAWLPEGSAPSRACVQVKGLARPGWRVELVITAAQVAH
ncbi:RidA family protein [Limnobacter sp.]|uniref:RidA family protein n=1 Tax=Limnobacter sp. TaxID=2003368 RepID=UPI0035140134